MMDNYYIFMDKMMDKFKYPVSQIKTDCFILNTPKHGMKFKKVFKKYKKHKKSFHFISPFNFLLSRINFSTTK